MEEHIIRQGENIYIAENTKIFGNLIIGHCSIIGSKISESCPPTIIHKNVNIGSFCVIESGVEIDEECIIDHYCSVYSNVRIGRNSKILYGAKLFSNSRIGNNCIIGGDIPERTILEDNVTMMGTIVHNHRDASLDWDTTDEPSPIIKKGAVIGCNSLIMGGVCIGEGAYVSVGEIVKCDIPPNSVFINKTIIPIKKFRGLIKSRML